MIPMSNVLIKFYCYNFFYQIEKDLPILRTYKVKIYNQILNIFLLNDSHYCDFLRFTLTKI